MASPKDVGVKTSVFAEIEMNFLIGPGLQLPPAHLQAEAAE